MVKNPTYREVCTKRTGHYEAVHVVFDPKQVSFEELARVFFETHDPTQRDGQGPDIGPQYRSAVFFQNEAQREVAQKLKDLLMVQKGTMLLRKSFLLLNFILRKTTTKIITTTKEEHLIATLLENSSRIALKIKKARADPLGLFLFEKSVAFLTPLELLKRSLP